MNANSGHNILEPFDPATREWFARSLGTPTAVQAQAWPAIESGEDVLIAAPTGSGKTLAAFLIAIDQLMRRGHKAPLPDATTVLYVSPLKALSNDIHKNLQAPLQGVADVLLEQGRAPVDVRAQVRTGDTPAAERSRMVRRPPHILVTTPESLFILLTSESGRALLGMVSTVIVDEIHALAGNKRGAHLALSLARLDALVGQPAQRIGLSATQKPLSAVGRFLTGGRPCRIIDTGHGRERDLNMVVPGSPLTAVMAGEVWAEVYDALAIEVRGHSTTLIFVNTRRLAERVTRHLGERLGEQHVAAHHGSLSREHRLAAEQRLKAGDLQALVATASLELGIDIGDVDLVCQIGSPRSIAALLQRVGRSGHAVNATPRGRVFPTTLDELVECTALLDAVEHGELDALSTVGPALDVLAQQIVAEVASREWREDELYALVCKTGPYLGLARDRFEQVVQMLADGYTARRGRRGAYLHRDAVNGVLRARRGARLVALTNAGVIPDQFDFDVVLMPDGLRIGSVNEDFAFESLPGDIFQLGNQSYRIAKVDTGRVLVEDARGLPPTIPFWFGEAPGRSDELSAAVSRLRTAICGHAEQGVEAAAQWLHERFGLPAAAAEQLVDYLTVSEAALGVMPSHATIVLERFFDDTGDMHLVVHSTYGSRINRAWGLALRKRFCRKFNFELQAAALEDTIILSLGVTHSFALEEVACYLNSQSVEDVLIQALLDAPMFPTRWRWNASVALAVRRHLGKRRTPPAWQRNDAEDLMAVVFPDQIACLENLSGPREIPDHPLVAQTLEDCLRDTMDVDGLRRLLESLESGAVKVVGVDVTTPSPLAQEVLNARPFAFLDDGDAETRRTLAVTTRSHMSLEEAGRLRHLDADAIARVRSEAWPQPRDADEMHDALLLYAGFTDTEVRRSGWEAHLDELARTQRATRLEAGIWVCAERLALWQRCHPGSGWQPPVAAIDLEAACDDPVRELVRSRLECAGPVTAAEFAAILGVEVAAVDQALLALEREGFAVRGRFEGQGEQWCERRLLARIHRYTLDRQRRDVQPVSPQVYQRFLLDWHGMGDDRPEGLDALLGALDRLEAYSAPAALWESELLPARISLFMPGQLDTLCAAGKVAWARLLPRKGGAGGTGPAKRTPVAFSPRENLALWRRLAGAPLPDEAALSSNARQVVDYLGARGASFVTEIAEGTGLLRAQIDEALAEIVACGLASADTFAGLRALISPARRPARSAPRTRRRRPLFSGAQDAGRWSLLSAPAAISEDEMLEHVIWALLTRYGVLARRLLDREALAPPWRKLLRVCWRLEARGEIRGGRFIDGLAGEQFALPDAWEALQRVRKAAPSVGVVVVSAADPCNLLGTLLPGDKLPQLAGNRVLFVGGNVQGWKLRDEIVFAEGVSIDQQARWQPLLLDLARGGRGLRQRA